MDLKSSTARCEAEKMKRPILAWMLAVGRYTRVTPAGRASGKDDGRAGRSTATTVTMVWTCCVWLGKLSGNRVARSHCT